ncbi:MAG: hypothetical protein A2X61_06980 [Ignavibacteria bacterium GWB2_35_12]|nr:MAG: hypothetical protein A2X61_06980 [Ignavibacteria bacterium GWB2_35_12]OGU93844.1 MAG: hypothetical protein A2220_11845 [Ignavibacteria bacterium RIFOXYA2_FULL_35_10]OGV22052.1 MAG: hypothetical protein A2475_09480 [Ignavibacteria bacterium RIFOXYC2_FULL_35_21]
MYISENGLKPIANGDRVIEKNLPLPMVTYPYHYGTFISFQKDSYSNIFLCECFREALEHSFEFNYKFNNPNYSSPSMGYAYINENIHFEKNICHVCNGIIPQLRWCHEMYGGIFKQNYGWYINKQSLEWGIEPLNKKLFREHCPQDILDLILIDPEELPTLCREITKYNSIKDHDKYWDLFNQIQKLSKNYNKQKRKISNIIENEVRQILGYKKVGEAWVSETLLYNQIKNLFPSCTVIRHYRPQYLNGLELDIYIDEYQTGIEYQGIQHFQPIKHWGGEEGFRKTQERDDKKKILCVKEGIRLIYVSYDKVLDDKTIYNLICNK